MREVVTTGQHGADAGGTVLLAIVANSYELLCTAGFPMVYTRALTLAKLESWQYYAWLAAYNVIYVLPLLAIVIVFTRTMGARKLTESEGRILKLVSGFMMLGFGLVLLFAPNLLTNALGLDPRAGAWPSARRWSRRRSRDHDGLSTADPGRANCAHGGHRVAPSSASAAPSARRAASTEPDRRRHRTWSISAASTTARRRWSPVPPRPPRRRGGARDLQRARRRRRAAGRQHQLLRRRHARRSAATRSCCRCGGMNRIRAVDAANFTIVVEAGCMLADVQAAAEAADRFFPLSLGAEGSCQIGGNLSTNAGGLNALRYGVARDLVLGLEVVLPTGACSTDSRACARTTPVTTSTTCSSARKARSA